MVYMWLGAVILFALVEVITTQLVSIWLAGGALAAFCASLAGADVTLQWILFVAVSAILLILTKPLVKKIINREPEKTNIDAQIGKTTIVTQKIDNIKETGEVRLNGISWTARSENGEPIDEGSRVLVEKIDGVKLIVKSVQ